jgi:hypothetical protein
VTVKENQSPHFSIKSTTLTPPLVSSLSTLLPLVYVLSIEDSTDKPVEEAIVRGYEPKYSRKSNLQVNAKFVSDIVK